MRAKKAAHAEKLEQENAAAEDFCPRIALLPEKIKICTLCFLRPRLIKKPPVHLLRAVQQAEEPPSTWELAKCNWVHRLHTNQDNSTLFKLAQRTSLVSTCPVVKPTFLLHNCDSLACSRFATLLHKEAGMQSFQQLQTTLLLSGFSMWSLDADVDAALRLCEENDWTINSGDLQLY